MSGVRFIAESVQSDRTSVGSLSGEQTISQI